MSSPASVSFEKGGRSERYANPPYALSIRVSGAGGCVGADGGTQRQPSTSLNSNERKELLVGRGVKGGSGGMARAAGALPLFMQP